MKRSERVVHADFERRRDEALQEILQGEIPVISPAGILPPALVRQYYTEGKFGFLLWMAGQLAVVGIDIEARYN